MDTSVIDELTTTVTMLNELLNACPDETRKYSTIRHVTDLISSHNLFYLNHQLEQITEELYEAITGNQTVQERPCEI